ncbi:hypothetical protein KGF57_003220 [Candida theae]|uniref:Uncharacterized protein n=1 Tax=Candida theae TaxID=1198502 RepID=A0AAD5BEB9_9ASCO|nr:uncharacterized protein KGF57_003220 [Candida theae]KAI5957526.1 hypothetical protein KGF57_003220 [Candida theae]
MGLCLSCLSGGGNDDEYDETASLLRRNQQGGYDSLQEEEILKQEQRQQELNNIVNDLSENLIDVTSFLNKGSMSGVQSQSQSQSQLLPPQFSNGDGNRSGGHAGTNGEGGTRTFPYVYSQSDKEKVLEKASKLPDSVRQGCEISTQEPLYLKF